MLRTIFTFCILLFTCHLANGQWRDTSARHALSQKSFKQRLRFNINGGLVFGTITNINIQPQLGYQLTPRFIPGIGGNFMYYRDNRYTGNNQLVVYGANAFGRYMISPYIFGQVEIQALQTSYSVAPGYYGLVGGGYTPGGGFYLSAYYLFLYPTGNNIYGLPYLFRVGYMF